MPKYQLAKHVFPVKQDNSKLAYDLKLSTPDTKRRRQTKMFKPKKNELVFISNSPSYCEYDTSTGSYGTSGRQCDNEAQDMSGCSLLCCGRGYHTLQETEVQKCNCKFKWCCKVICDTCANVTTTYICR